MGGATRGRRERSYPERTRATEDARIRAVQRGAAAQALVRQALLVDHEADEDARDPPVEEREHGDTTAGEELAAVALVLRARHLQAVREHLGARRADADAARRPLVPAARLHG